MNSTLCVSIRFIQPFPLFHGSRDAGEAEWPPSPMRVFQALLNAACLRVRGKPISLDVRNAMHVLEVLRPHVVAPRATLSTIGHRAYVPHNQYDLVAMALHRGMEQSTEAFRKLNGSVRVDKDIRPMRIEVLGDEMPTVHYLYPLESTNAEPQSLLDAIRPSVRSIHCLGWGIDQVVADVQLIDDEQSSRLIGERFIPATRGGSPLRAPRKGSLDALHARHERFLSRLTGSDWTPVPPVIAVDRVRYRRATDLMPRPNVVFKLLDPIDEDTARYPHDKLIHIAGMVRHLAIERMKNDPPSWIDDPKWLETFVCGHRGDGDLHKQISYVPLPSIGHEHADAMIRNVMLIAPLGCERELEYVAERLDVEALKSEEQVHSTGLEHSLPVSGPMIIERFTPPRGRFIEKYYLGTSRVWQTVTPVILDGHTKKSKSDKPEAIAEATEKLLCKALQRAGIETPCEFSWQSNPYLKNCLSAHKYDRDGRHTGYHRPAHLKNLTAVHVRLTFAHPVPGPLTIGAGRHCGFGTMACIHDGFS